MKRLVFYYQHDISHIRLPWGTHTKLRFHVLCKLLHNFLEQHYWLYSRLMHINCGVTDIRRIANSTATTSLPMLLWLSQYTKDVTHPYNATSLLQTIYLAISCAVFLYNGSSTPHNNPQPNFSLLCFIEVRCVIYPSLYALFGRYLRVFICIIARRTPVIDYFYGYF